MYITNTASPTILQVVTPISFKKKLYFVPHCSIALCWRLSNPSVSL